jgi:hypothetical protein
MVRYRCTRCGGLIEVDESQRGRLHSCPHCHVASEVPAAASRPARHYGAVNGLIVAGALMSAACLASVIMHSPSPTPAVAQAGPAQAKPAVVARSQAKPAPAAAAVPSALPPAAIKPAPAVEAPTPVSAAAAARQGAIVSADFASEKVAIGTAPRISPLNRPWVSRRPDLEPDCISGVVTTRAGRAVGLMVSIKRAPSFTPPAKMHLSATVKPGVQAAAAEDFRGVGVGFFSSDPQATGSRLGFYGVILTPEGKVVLWLGQKGNDGSAAVAYPGAWDPKAWHTVDFDVDTASRKLINLQVDGKSLQFGVATSDFAEANIPYLGIMLSATPRAAEMPSVRDISLVSAK